MTPTATPPATETITLPYLPEPAHKITFENGHTLVFVKRKGAVFNVSSWVKTGSMNEDEANNGVSHFLEHLMFKGTPRFEAGVFDKKMESMGALINAATWKDFTFYYVTGPNSDYNEFDTVVDMHADMVLHPLLPDAEIGEAYDPDKGETPTIKRERGVVIEEIGLYEDRPWSRLYNLVNDLMYEESHPYRREVIGTRRIVGTIPRSQIEAYYKRWYTPENITTIVVGEFELDTIVPKVEKAFNFADRTDPKEALAIYKEPAPPERFVGKHGAITPPLKTKSEFGTRFAILGFHGPKAEDVKTTLALEVAISVLGESRSSRFTQHLIDKQTPSAFNTVSASQYTLKLGNTLYVMANFNGTDSDVALKELTDILTDFTSTTPITPEEFARTVKKMKVDVARGFETCAGIADMIGESLTVTGSLTGVTDILKNLDALTLDDVVSASQQYLAPSLAYTAVMEPA
jgi:zinc protease